MNPIITMQLTHEQLKFIKSEGDARINAVSGSGKTTSLIQYALKKPPKTRILFLAVNDRVKKEIERKISSYDVINIRVETLQSIAERYVTKQLNFKIRTEPYRNYEISDILKIRLIKQEPLSGFIMASHVLKFTSFFCLHSNSLIGEVDYIASLQDIQARRFARANFKEIELAVKRLMGKMEQGEIPVSTEFCLKKFQLSETPLDYDLIIMDEGQDAPAVVLDVFMNQKAVKVFVNDKHGRLSKLHEDILLQYPPFKEYEFTTSFRYDKNIAFVLSHTLELKKLAGEKIDVNISALAVERKTTKQEAFIANKSVSLFRRLAVLAGTRRIKSLYFEGHFNAYLFNADGISLYDLLSMYTGEKNQIRSFLVKKMFSFKEIVDFAAKTDDTVLSEMLEVVNEFHFDLPMLLTIIRDFHTSEEEKKTAGLIFSTPPNCSGNEYDEVNIEADFICREDIIQETEKKDAKPDLSKIINEINRLYVAISRTKNILHLAEKYAPLLPNVDYTKETEPPK